MLVIPAKRVTSPAVATLDVSATCLVRWSDHKIYKATVLAMGDGTSMGEEQRKYMYGSDENTNTINTNSRKRAANASAQPPLKKKQLSTIKKSAIPKKKQKSKQP